MQVLKVLLYLETAVKVTAIKILQQCMNQARKLQWKKLLADMTQNTTTS